MKIEIPTPVFLTEISNESVKAFEQDVMQGPLFRSIIQRIEDTALAGFERYSRKIDSSDQVRSFKVIQKNLVSAGYYCEIEVQTKRGLLIGEYKEQYFVIDWSKKH